MKIEITVDPRMSNNLAMDLETMHGDFSEILLSTEKCDTLNIKDDTAIFHLRTLYQLQTLLSKISTAIKAN